MTTPNVNKYRTTNYQPTTRRPASNGVGWAILAILLMSVIVAGLVIGLQMAQR